MQWAEFYHNTRLYMESTRMHHKHIADIQLHQHQSQNRFHGASQPTVGPSHSPDLLPKGVPWAWVSEHSYSRTATGQCWGCFFSPTEISLLCKESILSLVFLLPAGLIPSCSYAFLLSMPDHSSVTDYHCWAVTIRISAAPGCAMKAHSKTHSKTLVRF